MSRKTSSPICKGENLEASRVGQAPERGHG